MRGRHLQWAVAFLLPLVLLTVSLAAAADKERMDDLAVSLENKEITVSVALVNGFSQEVVHDLQNGIPKDFYFYFLLKKVEAGWFFDEEVLAKTIRFTVKYDSLKKQFLVTRRDGTLVEEVLLDSLEEVKGLISKISSVRIAPLSLLKPRRTYYISVKAQMKASELPLYLDYFLFFIPFLELDTPWADSKTFSQEALPG